MAVRNASLRRDPKSGSWKARRAISEAIRTEYAAAFGPRHEAKFSAAADLSERDARTLFADWNASIEARFKAMHDKAAGRGQTLSHRERFALIGEWHKWFAAENSEPGKAADWEAAAEHHFDAVESICQRFAGGSDQADLDEFDWTTHPQARPLVLAQISSAARLEDFLADRLEILAPQSRDAFIDDLGPELRLALEKLQHLAGGDYSATANLERFPKRNRTAGLTPSQLFGEWVLARKPALNTTIRWRDIFRQLDKFFEGRDVGSLTEQDAFDWRQALRTRLSDKSINEGYVVAAKAVFGWAVNERRLSSNPFATLKASPTKKPMKVRERSFKDSELQLILKASLKPAPARMKAHAHARRWVPWLCIYSGARGGEVCQLRKEDLIRIGDHWALKFTPDAGTIKANEARTIPLHEHLIAQGFVQFVQAQQDGPLFYDAALLRKADNDPTNPRRHPAEKVRMRLAEWVREIGVSDRNISPIHAFRNTWKNNALHAGIDNVVRDFVQGHAPATVGDAYTQLEGEKGFKILLRELEKYPRIEIEDNVELEP